MTMAARLAAAAPLGPVIDALTVLGKRYPTHGLAPELTVPAVDGWTPATALLCAAIPDAAIPDGGAPDGGALPGGDPLDGLLGAAQRRWDTSPHVAAALAWKAYVYWVSLPAVLGYATVRRVPLPDPAHVLLRYSDEQPFLQMALYSPTVLVLPTDPLAQTAAAGVRVVPDEAAMLASLRHSLLDGHLSPLVERIHERVRLGRRTLLGSLASAVALTMSRLGETLELSTVDTATELLSTLDIADLVELSEKPDGGLTVQRLTCCLAFATPEPRICASCCIR